MVVSVEPCAERGALCVERKNLAALLAGGQLIQLASLSRDQEHFAGETRERPIAPAIIRFFDDQTGQSAQLGETSGSVEANAMLARAGTSGTAPSRLYRQNARQRIEASLLRVERSVRGFPPIASQEARHDAVTAASVPHESAVGRQNTPELHEHAFVVGRIGKEAK